ncbi:SH3 domain-containing protein [Virgibacillus doumboii]|uniref:SH3 domain-containing protein n=1 Tax=Virgibacillus doumboii TaxID=2697503 RepID=UPI0013E08B0F|nr:SH3 domain-containing protein [Virgibacillus doumboii]
MEKYHLRKFLLISCLLGLVLSLVAFPMNNNTVQAATVYEGVALKDPTNVYSNTSRSDVIKSYRKGSILLYMPHSSNWYRAIVYVNGKSQNGYIHKSDVENSVKNQKVIKGVGNKNPTSVYSEATTNSGKLKSYDQGSILYYKTYTSGWYEAIVYVNGDRKTGYINKSHVDNIINDQKVLKGIGLKSPTAVYSKASTNSSKLKTYGQGSVLYYKTFTNSWYEALVYVDGNPTTGYIHKSHVEEIVDNQKVLKGIGLKSPTAVYSRASTHSGKLKSYSQGSILYYKTFTSNWYEALVYVNGKRRTGYIHNNHVEGIYDKQEALKGRAIANPTNVYSRASRNSRVVKDYSEGSILYFDTFSPNWYQGFVYVDGIRKTIYINRADVTIGDVTNVTKYNYTFETMVDIQMTKTPKANGAGTIPATREQVEYYANPSNFTENTDAYFQFLDLSQSAGLNAKEINRNILKGKGSLEGTGQAFIDAGRRYNINEAYLIAHTLHETANGTSTLAAGVPVDGSGNVVNPKNAVHTVYNMYGYGARDECPLECGAKYAFEKGWFTPSAAILGGASGVSTYYIQKGQDTLYKMRWNPANPGTHQYATHVAWAVAQTSRISEIYDLINNYTLVYDVPQFSSQPDSSGTFGVTDSGNENLNLRNSPNGTIIGKIPDGSTVKIIGTDGEWYNVKYNGKFGWAHGDYINKLNSSKVQAQVTSNSVSKTMNVVKPELDKGYPSGVFGLTDTGNDNLNLRKKPDGSIIGSIPNGSTIEVISTNGAWNKVRYDDNTGWVHGDYVEIQNLLQITATNLNVRETPGGNTLGQVSNIFMKAVIDNNNNYVTNNEWYQVYYNGKKAWVSDGKDGSYIQEIK